MGGCRRPATEEDIARAWATVRCSGADRRADRGGDLDRFGDPGLPRPERGVDEEPGGREGVDDRALPRRSRGPAAGVAAAGSTAPALTAEPERRAPGDRRAANVRAGSLAVVTQNVDGLHQKAGHRSRPGDRGARHDLVHPLLGLRGPAPDGRHARPGPTRARPTRRASSAAGSSRATRSASVRPSCRR